MWANTVFVDAKYIHFQLCTIAAFLFVWQCKRKLCLMYKCILVAARKWYKAIPGPFWSHNKQFCQSCTMMLYQLWNMSNVTFNWLVNNNLWISSIKACPKKSFSSHHNVNFQYSSLYLPSRSQYWGPPGHLGTHFLLLCPSLKIIACPTSSLQN